MFSKEAVYHSSTVYIKCTDKIDRFLSNFKVENAYFGLNIFHSSYLTIGRERDEGMGVGR